MKMKYVSVLVLAFLVFSVSVNYLINQNTDDKYYNSYEKQINSTNKSMEYCQSAMSSIMLSMMGQNITNSNITSDLMGANNSTVMAINYSQVMLSNAKTDSQKKYASLLLNQSNDMLKFIDLLSILSVSTKDSIKVNNIMKQLDSIKSQEESYQNDLDSIRSTDNDLDKHLGGIEEKYKG